MKTVTIKFPVYRLEELKGNAKDTAVQAVGDLETSDEWWYESVIEDAKRMGDLMGLAIDQVYFSGFWSPGDGACFTGSYSYRKGAAKAVKEWAPLDKELHNVVDYLQELQARNFYRLSTRVSHVGRGYHENCTEFEYPDYGSDEDFERLKFVLRGYMQWIYRRLEAEYDYFHSEDYVNDRVLEADMWFRENGDIYQGEVA